MALTQTYTAVPNDVITAARWNNEFGNIYNNGTLLAFPVTTAVSFAGFTITLDAAGATTLVSTGSVALSISPGSKSGTPGSGANSGNNLNIAASTFTDTNTAGSGTAAEFSSVSIQRPTLAASNTLVTTTDAATLYINNAPAAGTNETITNAYALWIDNGYARFDGQLAGDGAPIVNELRLTLTTALPVTTADVTGAGTLYLTPYRGKHISLYDGTIWKTFSTAEISLALTLTSGKPYDVFAVITAGAPALEVLVWTDDTTRATALARQDGVLVKSGATTRRYLGTLYATGADTTEDSFAKRNLWNYYNRVTRGMKAAVETADSWTYTLATWRQANANAANQLECVIGVAEDSVQATSYGVSANGTASIDRAVGIGVDSTSVDSSNFRVHNTGALTASNRANQLARYGAILAAGRHTLVWLERSIATTTSTWYGDDGTIYLQTGIAGETRG